MDFNGILNFNGRDDDDEGEEEEKKVVSRKRVREESDDDDDIDEEMKQDNNIREVSDMFVCSGDGCYEKLLHVVVNDGGVSVLPCPLFVRADKYSRFVNGRVESYDVRSLIERLNKVLYVDMGTKFSEWCKYVMVDGILGDKNNSVFLVEMLMKVVCGALIVDMASVDVDTMSGELKMSIEKMRRMVTLLDEYVSPLEQYVRLPVYNMVMGCWYGYVCMDPGIADKFRMLVERLKMIAQSNSALYLENKDGKELYSHIKLISAWWVMRSTGFEKLMHLPSTAGEDMEILQPKPIEATEIMCSLLCSRGVILVDNGSGVSMYALPIYVGDQFTYTYSKPYKFGELMRELNVLDSYSHLFAQFGSYIDRYFETTTVEKSVPYVDNKYFTTNRFVSWRNGIFCCITGVFYYNEDGLRRSRMPENWPYTVTKLKILMGKNMILSMKYMDMDMLYDVYWMLMIVGLFRRSMGQYVNLGSRDEDAVVFEDGMDSDMVCDSFTSEEKNFVAGEMIKLSDNIHNPVYLSKLDPLDVRLRGAQKIVGDQRMPRGAYRILLEMFGRCFTGVIRSGYDLSNDRCGGPSFQYRMLTRNCEGLEDRMDIGTVMSGAARTGKSTLGDMVKMYFNAHHVGVMGDKERNINSFSTIVGRQVIMNLDLIVDMDTDKLPLKAPHIKKGITGEDIVHDELHSNISKIIRFFVHFLFASNGQFPYPNIKMDMALRFAFFEFPLASNMNVGDTPLNMFNKFDAGLFLVVGVMAHLRRLLNVKSKIFYAPPSDNQVFKIPNYLMKTQMNYIRDKDSVHAFIMENRSTGKMILNSDERGHTMQRDLFLAMYKRYCKHHACEEKKDNHVDEVLKKDFNISMDEEISTSYIGLKLA